MTSVMDSPKDPRSADGLLGASTSNARPSGAMKVLSRVFLRPYRKGRPARTHLLVVARHRRAALSKSR